MSLPTCAVFQLLFDFLETLAAIETRFPDAQHVEVWTIEDEKTGHEG